MGEQKYMDKGFCLDCMEKHAQRMEHHGEDMVTATADDPELRQKAQEVLDAQREIRKRVDEIRVEEKAKKLLRETV
jgi:hypothetical protein